MLLSLTVGTPAFVFDLAIDPIKEIKLGLPLARVERKYTRELLSVLMEGTDFKIYEVKVQDDMAGLNLHWKDGDPRRHIRRVALWFSYELETHQQLKCEEFMQRAELLTGTKGQHKVIEPESKAEAWYYPYGLHQVFVLMYIDVDGSYKVMIYKQVNAGVE
jgi:hypothetical protein